MAGLAGGQRTWIVAGLIAAAFAAGFGLARLTAAPPATPVAQAARDGTAWSLFGKPRAADAPRAAPRKPDGFTVWTSRLDSRGTAPSACIRMTRPLDPRRSYGDFVSVSPGLGHPAAVTAHDDELCVADVGYAGRTVTLLRGLPSAGGETLAGNADVEFVAGAKPIYVGFSGEGVILPREDADGVGLETVNVNRLHLEVWRVPDRNLVRKQISAPQPSITTGAAVTARTELIIAVTKSTSRSSSIGRLTTSGPASPLGRRRVSTRKTKPSSVTSDSRPHSLRATR